MNQLENLRSKWKKEGIENFHPAKSASIQTFEKRTKTVLPDDFKEYFEVLNGTGEEYTDELYEFYPVDRIRSVAEEFKDWQGVPDYQSIIALVDSKSLFVFANFSFNLFAYAIKLDDNKAMTNEVYVLCGTKHKKISNTFSNFVDLYLSNSIELQLSDE